MPDHESTGATPGLKAHELAVFYLDTLEDLMDPKEYAELRALTFAVLGAVAESVGPDDPPSECRLDINLTAAVLEEWLTVMGILGSGRMDQQIVGVGDGSRTVVDSETAADPEALRIFCAQVRERNRAHKEERDNLNGIEAAST